MQRLRGIADQYGMGHGRLLRGTLQTECETNTLADSKKFSHPITEVLMQFAQKFRVVPSQNFLRELMRRSPIGNSERDPAVPSGFITEPITTRARIAGSGA